MEKSCLTGCGTKEYSGQTYTCANTHTQNWEFDLFNWKWIVFNEMSWMCTTLQMFTDTIKPFEAMWRSQRIFKILFQKAIVEDHNYVI